MQMIDIDVFCTHMGLRFMLAKLRQFSLFTRSNLNLQDVCIRYQALSDMQRHKKFVLTSMNESL